MARSSPRNYGGHIPFAKKMWGQDGPWLQSVGVDGKHRPGPSGRRRKYGLSAEVVSSVADSLARHKVVGDQVGTLDVQSLNSRTDRKV